MTSELSGPHVFAFWKYDQFPYVLGDEGTLQPDGSFRAFGYGGARFMRSVIVAIYPLELGKELRKKLDVVRAEYYAEVEEIRKAKTLKVSEIIIEMTEVK